MVSPIDGEIRVTVTSEGEIPSVTPAGAPSGGPTPGDQKKGFKSLQDLGAFGKKMMPFAAMGGVVGLLIATVRKTASFMTTMGAIFDMLGAFVDVLLAPLMPLFGALLKLIIPFIPLFQKMAKVMIGPMIAFYEAILEPLTKIVELITTVLGSIFEAVGNKLIDLFTNAGDLIALLLSFVLVLPVLQIYTVLRFIQGFVEGLLGNLEDIDLSTKIDEIIDKLFGLIMDIGDIAYDIGELMGAGLAKLINPLIDVCNWLKDRGFGYISGIFTFLEKIMGFFGGGGWKKAFQPWKWFQAGIPYVPETIPAILHRGERVLTASENRGYSTNRIVNVTAPITVTAYSEVDVAMLGDSISSKILEVLTRELR